MSICTGRGNDGDTDLLFGKRLPKSDERFVVGGSLDELNAHIGVVRSQGVIKEVESILNNVQQNLVSIMGEVATLTEDLEKYAEKGYSKITDEDLIKVKEIIRSAESGEGAICFKGWARPGEKGVAAAAYLDVCRTVCRRAEREFWKWDINEVYTTHKRYLNHLSDLFWILARESEKEV